jgi:hypothetical protein
LQQQYSLCVASVDAESITARSTSIHRTTTVEIRAAIAPRTTARLTGMKTLGSPVMIPSGMTTWRLPPDRAIVPMPFRCRKENSRPMAKSSSATTSSATSKTASELNYRWPMMVPATRLPRKGLCLNRCALLRKRMRSRSAAGFQRADPTSQPVPSANRFFSRLRQHVTIRSRLPDI